MIVDRYYYSRLPDNEKQVYKEIYKGCMEHKDIIPLTATENQINKSCNRILQALTDDNPLLYFVNQSVMDIAKDSAGNMAVMPQYFFSNQTISNYNKKIQNVANKLISDLKLTEGSEQDKVRKVHDYICSNVEYDYGGSDGSDISRFIAAHNIIGVFAHRKAQCEGIAKAVKVLLNAVDVKCIFVTGKSETDNGLGDHGWNIVNIDGQPYHLDVTMDIGAGSDEYVSYDYFNITDAQIRKNHVFSTGYPKCTSVDKNYFVLSNTLFSSKKKIQEYISREMKSGKMMVYFRLTGKLKAAEVYEEMINFGYQILCDMGKENVHGYRVINEDMNTCRIIYR